MELQIKKIYPDAIIPTRAYSTDSGLDLYAYIAPVKDSFFVKGKEHKRTADVLISAGKKELIHTGIAIKLPEPTEVRVYGSSNPSFIWEAQVRSKSGRAMEGLMVLNSPGTVDNSYTGEIKVILYNSSKLPRVIKHGEKIAQLVVCPIVIPTLSVVEDFITGEEERGSNGFGSTGI